jgi:hypothetical protein
VTKKFVDIAKAWEVPVVAHTSKSGKGLHIRTFFSQPIQTFLARAMYLAMLVCADVAHDKAVDKVWPPVNGFGVLALPYNARWAIRNRGTLAVDLRTLEPLPKHQQLDATLHAPSLEEEHVIGLLQEMGVHTEGDAMKLSGDTRNDGEHSWIVRDQVDGGIDVMIENCLAAQRFMEFPSEASYSFWFAMMTNFKPFIHGKELFEKFSQLDPDRFDQKELDRSWGCIRGKPRLCANFDWKCPLLGQCLARSPAALPIHMKRLGII